MTGPLLLILLAPTAPPDAAGLRFFEQKIRPVLVRHCQGCHSAEVKQARGGLRVDTREALTRGGDTGQAIVPGDPDASLLLKALRHAGPKMPPKEKLPASVVADFEAWVRMGAPDPRTGKAVATPPAIDIEKGKGFWSFRPPRLHPVPAVKDVAWPTGTIDRFLLARLEAKGLRPAADAEPNSWLRRATFVLAGMPPNPEEIDAFLNDASPHARRRIVDRLLASPAFGERWGRHWLDVARYADSNGKDENLTFHEAHLYRDWVIRSLNDGKRFDTFLREQVAGDLMLAPTAAEREERMAGSGFLILGPKVLADRDQARRRMDVIDEQIDTMGRAFLGLSLGCARCHDHKFDPVPTRDYHAIAGILGSTRTLDGFKLGNPVVSGWSLRHIQPEAPKLAASRKTHEARMKSIRQRIGKAKGESRATLEAEARRLADEAPPPPRLVMAPRDEDAPGDMRIHIRGSHELLGATVPRGFLQVASWSGSAAIPAGQSGRLQLADWLADRRNPLTARVIVNRVWKHVFGEGLVRTVDDFGTTGTRPTHPELLDTLAVEFMEDGWRIKPLVRRLVLSRAFGLAVASDAEGDLADPENTLLWRGNRRRLEAEPIRDAMLAVSGELRRVMGGSSVSSLGERAVDNDSKGGIDTDGDLRRAVYLPVLRNSLPPLFEAFDFADPDVATGRREATTVPAQALFMLNSPFVSGRARAAAVRLLAEPGDERRVKRLYLLALGRLPSERESRRALAFVGESDTGERQAWAALCQAVFGCTEFRFVE